MCVDSPAVEKEGIQGREKKSCAEQAMEERGSPDG